MAEKCDVWVALGFAGNHKQAVTGFECVWSSRGTKSRDQASVWQPTLETGLLQRNTARVCVGHYPNASFKPVVAAARPSRTGCTLQVTLPNPSSNPYCIPSEPQRAACRVGGVTSR